MPRKKVLKTKVETPTIAQTPLYSVILKVNEKEYQAIGETLEEAINNIKIDPIRGAVKIYTKGTLKVKKGDKEVERFLQIRHMSRLFGEASKLGKEVAMVHATRVIKAFLGDK